MRSPIERASANDVVTLATDRGPAPMNIGAVLIVDDAVDLDFATVTSVLESRLPRVRRLRQRLIKTPPGCGRPIWVDDPGFDLSRHLSQMRVARCVGSRCGSRRGQRRADPGDRGHHGLYAAVTVSEPLWAARWVTGLAHDRAALILVMHHALTDGVGGLAVLAALGDDGPDIAVDSFPLPPPRTPVVVRRGLAGPSGRSQPGSGPPPLWTGRAARTRSPGQATDVWSHEPHSIGLPGQEGG